ncbi:MAG: hypothetical protein H0V88_10645 [Pyrinomonadaceae bacterium]|nr:hypothetical protein [Pyrinomonadaceae bacterium]
MNPRRLFLFSLTLLCGFLLLQSALAPAQESANSASALPQAEINRIIRAFSAKEAEFRQALNQYSFKRDAVIQQIGMGGQIAGEYHRVSQFIFDDKGVKSEKIVFFPLPNLPGLQITLDDLEDLGGVNAFALEVAKIDQYNFTYAGKERIDELDLYVFDVAPKVMPDPKKTRERFFQGRIWVDDHDLQIVKTRGKGVPETKESKFPIYDTYREHIDGRFWFPTYAYSDEELVFGNGSVLHVRARIRYSDYKRARGTATVIFDDEPEPTPTPSPTPPPRRKP